MKLASRASAGLLGRLRAELSGLWRALTVGRGSRMNTLPRDWRLLAEAGDAEAQYNLAVVQDIGRQSPANHAEAARWYRRAAEQGHAGAQHGLAYLHREGRGVPQDDREAARWYREAAAQGHAEAQYALGDFAASGRGGPRDPSGAVGWFREAAERGHAHAQYRLALMLAEGRGTEPSLELALAWVGRAAAQGLPEAQLWLGQHYESGDLLPGDPVEAHRWLSLAARGLPPGETREAAELQATRLRSTMTERQIAESLRLVSSYVPRG